MTFETALPCEANTQMIWSLWRSAPGVLTHPSALVESACVWRGSTEQLTIGSLVNGTEPDDSDWWLTTDLFMLQSATLDFPSVSGYADVWLNGERSAVFNSAFHPWRLHVAGQPTLQHIALHFPSLNNLFVRSHGRTRWRTNLVTNQHLRSHRVSLAGRIPGWFNRTPLVGISGPVTVTSTESCSSLSMTTFVVDERAHLRVCAQASIFFGSLKLEIDGRACVAPFTVDEEGKWRATVEIDCGHLRRWYPHTHGESVLHEARIAVGTNAPVQRMVGFRSVSFDRETGLFTVNGVPVFCRGACWVALQAAEVSSDFDLEKRLRQVRDAGFNMLRVVGTSCYESDEFYDLCDRLGVLVWQDLPFANMAYPDTQDFVDSVHRELEWQSRRLAWRTSLAVVCGNSDAEQQATLLGLHEIKRTQPLFTTTLKYWCAELFSSQEYLPSAPGFGPLPTHLSVGVSSYFGVGAYRRSLDDRSIEQVRFASECLGFANIPDQASMSDVFGTLLPSLTSAGWKAGTPRDNGVGWDFDDVRDHYTEQLFAESTLDLRMHDLPRYLELSRLSSGIAMASVFARWRVAQTRCQGGLIWMMHDIRPGAGWGLVDSIGRPKPAYHLVRNVLRPVQVLVTDENFDGHNVHLINELDVQRSGILTIALVLADGRAGGKIERAVDLPPRSTRTLSVDGCFDRFQDTTWAYRFGRPAFRAVAAELRLSNGTSIQHVAMVGHAGVDVAADVQITARLAEFQGVTFLQLDSDRLLEWARLETGGLEYIDNYVHVIPGIPCRIEARSLESPLPELQMLVKPVNSRREFRVRGVTTP